MDDEKLLESFPALTGEDIHRINGLFTPYVFYTTTADGGRDCECTACGKAFQMDGLPRLRTPEWRAFMGARRIVKRKAAPASQRAGEEASAPPEHLSVSVYDQIETILHALP